MLGYFSAAGIVMYKGYMAIGPTMLLVGWPFAMVFGFLAQSAILNALPPTKLEPYAGHRIWLKLN